ncbi:hypothetical protein CGLO_06299 [Colletotrichum gloeosporioides Cg-14]|uniref:Uncharacterized protein n=1 Tax=Colletotrichum gloeosporioides (strain Cg-14) TaxID=1237896 RepID=T0KML1_COLGC|nr:hypothetical protein CGLO_06299 [Colletotrichum gloeosporioides Cg-14]
MQGKDLISI